MTQDRQTRCHGATVCHHLLNLSRDQQVYFNFMLQRYAAERFLYRLSVSNEVDRFTLRDAALLRIWDEQKLRPTCDVDLFGFGSQDHSAIRSALDVICSIPYSEDSVVFDASTIRIRNIRRHLPEAGQRARIQGNLGGIRLNIHLDLGSGDVITSEREEQDYSTLLEMPPPASGPTRGKPWSPRGSRR